MQQKVLGESLFATDVQSYPIKYKLYRTTCNNTLRTKEIMKLQNFVCFKSCNGILTQRSNIRVTFTVISNLTTCYLLKLNLATVDKTAILSSLERMYSFQIVWTKYNIISIPFCLH